MWRMEVKNMEKNTLLIIGLVGGIIAAVGVFLPWISVFGVSTNGFNGNSGKVIVLGGVLALIGGLAALVVKGASAAGYLIPVGGIVSLLGWLWAGSDVGFGNLTNFHTAFGYA